MNIVRGDIVLVDFPFSTGSAFKVRPALVIQNDLDNRRLVNTIIAQITSVARRASQPTQCVVEVNTPEGKQSGLVLDSVINCVNLATIHEFKILRTLGRLPAVTMQRINGALHAALELP